MIKALIQRGWPVAALLALSLILLGTGNLSTVFGLGFWSYELYWYWATFLAATIIVLLGYIWVPQIKYALLAMLSAIFGAATYRAEADLWLSYFLPMESSQLFITVNFCLLTATVVVSIATVVSRGTNLVLPVSVAILLSLAPAAYSSARLAALKATSNNSLVPTPGQRATFSDAFVAGAAQLNR